MYAVKETSTNQLNRKELVSCPVTYTLDKIGGRWKPTILFYLSNGPMRYGVLKRSVAAISEKMLIQSLRELESDNIVARDVMDAVPPQITYSLTTLGKSLKPVLRAMAEWGQKNSSIK